MSSSAPGWGPPNPSVVPPAPTAASSWPQPVAPQPMNVSGWQTPGGGYPAPSPYGARPAVPKNGMGIAGLVLGIVSLFLFGFIFGILAIIFSSIGMQRANNGQATNKNMAIWGLVLGIIGLVGWTIFLLA